MAIKKAFIIVLFLALVALATGTVLSAAVAPAPVAVDPLPPQQATTTTDDAAADMTAPVDIDPRSVSWQEPMLETRPSGITPDGTFMDAESQNGMVLLNDSAALDKTAAGKSPGIYMARDWRPVAKTDFPMLTGGHDLFTWGELEPQEGVYNWVRLDNMINNNAATGKKSAFGITTYNGRIEGGIVAPTWLTSNYPQAIVTCAADGWKIPRYWNSVYKTKYTNFITALANRYKNNANVAWVQIGVGLYGEIQPSDDRDDGCVQAAMSVDGYTNTGTQYDLWVATVNWTTDMFMARFNTGKPVFLVYTPSFISSQLKCYTTEYAAGKYGTGLFAGGMYANQTDVYNNWPSITYPYNCRKWDPINYWNNSPTATVPIAFETYRYMLPDLDQFYWGMLSALNKHPDYLNLESDLFFANKDPNQKITENFPMMYFADQYLGKTIATTPDVWVAMRESDPATNGYGKSSSVWPQFGNYDFWMTQDQAATGGRTITATTVNLYYDTQYSVWRNDPFYDPILVGKGPQGWITRRTSTASGNNYFYLNVNDSFASTRISSSAIITVTWFDVITTTGTTWALEYKDINDNTQTRTVTRSNSRQWVTSVFYLNDIKLNNQFSGNDFRLYNGGVADLYVHMVKLGSGSGGEPPTATPTVTPGGPTETPTATPTTTPTATVTPTTLPGVTLRINPGGPDYTDGNSNVWLADRPFATGSWGHWTAGTPHTYFISGPIAGTNDDILYQSERYWGTTGGYTITVPSGNYNVELKFAELFYTTSNSRRFQVAIQGVTVLDNFDIVAQAGALTALDRTFPATVVDGILSIQFTSQTDSAKINGIYVYPAGSGGPTATATPTATPTTGGPTPTNTATIPAGQQVTTVYQNGVSPDGFYASSDTYLSSQAGETASNYCSSQTMYARAVDVRDPLLMFPLPGIPSNAVVVSATLSLYAESRSNTNPLTIGAYRMLRDWNPCSATWNEASSGVFWGAGGANDTSTDRVGTADDFVSMAMTMTWHNLNLTNMVQQWVSNPSSNKGVILKPEAGNVQYTLRSGDMIAVPSTRPKLTVVYALPGDLPTATTTSTATVTPTATPVTPSATPTFTQTPSPTITPGGPTFTPTVTPSRTPTLSPTLTPTLTRTITPTPTIAYDIRVNAGGPQYVDGLGKVWAADKAYTAGSWGYTTIGSTSSTTTTVSNTSDPVLYRTERYWGGNGGYRFDVPVQGEYEIDLLFAETWPAVWQKGQRYFTIQIEGYPYYSSFDIFSTAGKNNAVVLQTNVTITDGALNIDFLKIAGSAYSPKVNAIRVLSVRPATPTPTITSTRTRTATVTNTPVGPTATATRTLTPTQTATATVPPGCPDVYEPDDTLAQARTVLVGTGLLHHNFNVPYDIDWSRFLAVQGQTYTILTQNLTGGVDTLLELYTSGGVPIASNDDDAAIGGGASRIVWQATASSYYYVKTYDYNADRTYGCATGYDLEVRLGAPSPTPTGTGTVTRTKTPTVTPTGSATPTNTLTPSITTTPSRTSTVTLTSTPSATLTHTPTATASTIPSPSATPTITPTPTSTPVGQPIACNSTVVGDLRGGTNQFVVYPCGGGSETGPERVYYLVVNSTTTVRARIASYQQNGTGNPDVFILSSYDNNTCVPGGYGPGDTASWATYTDAGAGMVYIVVDGWQGWQDQFTLTVECDVQGTPTPTTTPTTIINTPFRLSLPIIISEFYQ